MLDPHVTHKQIKAEAIKRFGRGRHSAAQYAVAKEWATQSEKDRLNNQQQPGIDYFCPRILDN